MSNVHVIVDNKKMERVTCNINLSVIAVDGKLYLLASLTLPCPYTNPKSYLNPSATCVNFSTLPL